MIYYILLIIASLLFGSQFMATKAYEKNSEKSVSSSVWFSAVSGFFACVIFLCANGFRLSVSPFSVLMAAALAVVSVFSNVVGLKTLSLGDIAVYSLFLMLGGMMVPFVVGAAFLREKVTPWQLAGMCILVFSLLIPVFEKRRKNGDGKKGGAFFYLLCSGLFILNGLSSTISKLHQINESAVDSLDFTVLLFAFQCVLASAVYLIAKFSKRQRGRVETNALSGEPEPERNTEKNKRTAKSVLCGFSFAVLNGTATFLQLCSAKYVNATAQFPIITGGTLVFSAILGRLIYKEKLSAIRIVQLAAAFCATVMFVF